MRLTILSFVFTILAALPLRANDRVEVINSSSNPVQVTGSITSSMGGAAHAAGSQVAASTSAGTLIIARPTRVGCLLRNLDASLDVYYGPATVTSANGMLLKHGESVVVSFVGLLQVIAVSGTPAIAVYDEYN